jgi:hypothetical protein
MNYSTLQMTINWYKVVQLYIFSFSPCILKYENKNSQSYIVSMKSFPLSLIWKHNIQPSLLKKLKQFTCQLHQ